MRPVQSSGGLYGNHLEEGFAKGCLYISTTRKGQSDGYYQGEGEDDTDIPTEFGIGKEFLDTSFEKGVEKQGEIYARKKHEKDGDILNVSRTESTDAGIAGRESSCGGGTHGMADAVKSIHAS